MLLNEEMTIQQMISKNPLKNFLYFEGQLPYKVNINTDFYIFDISVDLNGNYDSKLKKGKYYLHHHNIGSKIKKCHQLKVY